MLPEKPWSCVHLDHAINFIGTNYLVITDDYSKYLCIYAMSLTFTWVSLGLLEEYYAHLGFPHTLKNAKTSISEEFETWFQDFGIAHLTAAPFYPATSEAAEKLVQAFKQAQRKSSLPSIRTFQEFMMQYWKMPKWNGFLWVNSWYRNKCGLQ